MTDTLTEARIEARIEAIAASDPVLVALERRAAFIQYQTDDSALSDTEDAGGLADHAMTDLRESLREKWDTDLLESLREKWNSRYAKICERVYAGLDC